MKSHAGESADFSFAARSYLPADGLASLAYRLDGGEELVEEIRFPHAPWPQDPSRQAAFDQALLLLHLVAGVSYWKAGIAPRMRIVPPLTLAQAEFVTRLYTNGLAEFALVNGLDLTGRINFPCDADILPAPQDLILPERALVAAGGGKDSLVALELARLSGLEVAAAYVGDSSLIDATVAAARVPVLRVGRRLAPRLLQLNAAGAWNGHVPVTAINSAILVCAAVLYGYRYVIFANERSADEATRLDASGKEVNHQYSKSTAFEADLRRIIASHISPGIEYFSILRPFSEIAIVGRFASLPDYHFVYSSCNRNFHLDGPHLARRWCGNCPKCRFAALALALFLEPAEVVAIQQGDLLDDAAQLEGFRELCGLGRDKPFECVGEIGESRAALQELAKREGWRKRLVVRQLAPLLAGVAVPDFNRLLRPAGQHFIPAPFLRGLELAPAA